MSQQPGVTLPELIKNRYFPNKLLTSADFINEQNYFNNKLELIKKAVIGSGCVFGLNVKSLTLDPNNCMIEIESGLAFDKGKEIVIEKERAITVPIDEPLSSYLNGTSPADKVLGLFLKHKLETDDSRRVMTLSTASTCKESCEIAYEKESFEAEFRLIDPNEVLGTISIDYDTNNRNKFARDFYSDFLEQACYNCDKEEGVLVAIVSKMSNTLVVDEAKTRNMRQVVYNNSMTYQLLAEHIINPKKMNVVERLNEQTGAVSIQSSGLEITAQNGIVRIEPNPVTLQTLSKTAEISLMKSPSTQDFGPFPCRMGNSQVPPAIILTTTNNLFDIGNYAYHYSAGSLLPIELSPINVTPDSFDVKVTINGTIGDNTKVFLRYYVLSPIESDNIGVVKGRSSRLSIFPPGSTSMLSEARIEITDPAATGNTINFKLSSKYTSENILASAYKSNSLYITKISADSINNISTGISDVNKIKSGPGDTLSIEYGNDTQYLMVLPKLDATDKIRSQDGVINGKLYDISQNDITKKVVLQVMVGGSTSTIPLTRSTRKEDDLSFSIPVETLNLISRQISPKFNGDIDVILRYTYLDRAISKNTVEFTVKTQIPVFFIYDDKSQHRLDADIKIQNTSMKFRFVVVDSELGPDQDVFLRIQTTGKGGGGQVRNVRLNIGTTDENNRCEITKSIDEIINMIDDKNPLNKIKNGDELILSYEYKVGAETKKITYGFTKQ